MVGCARDTYTPYQCRGTSVNRDQFELTVERHLRGLVRFAAWSFPAEHADPQDVVADALLRVVADGAYLKYEFEPGAAPRRAPVWLRQAIYNSGLAMITKDRRQRRLARRWFGNWRA